MGNGRLGPYKFFSQSTSSFRYVPVGIRIHSHQFHCEIILAYISIERTECGCSTRWAVVDKSLWQRYCLPVLSGMTLVIAGERGKLRRYMTERMTRPRGKTALLFLVTAALLTAIVLLACGPAADDGDKEGDPAASTVPTATPKGDEPTKQPDPPATAAPTETPKPAEEPTKTPEPTPAEKPTETPMSTRHPDDPPSPTATPVPTYPPTTTPDPLGLVDPVIRRVPHPDGVQGCRSMNDVRDGDRLETMDYLQLVP